MKELTSAELKTLRCLELAANWKGYFIGTISVEPQILWAPKKHDASEFGQFFLLKYWSLKEKLVCAEQRVPFFETEVLAQTCPGLRCDGMHFASDFEDWKCSSHNWLWDFVIARFMSEHEASWRDEKLGSCNNGTAFERYDACMVETADPLKEPGFLYPGFPGDGA